MKLLKGVRVETTYDIKGRKRTYKIEGLILDGSFHTFETSDGKKLTIEVSYYSQLLLPFEVLILHQRYYQMSYGIRLRFPKAFAIKVTKTAIIPAELLNIIPGQPFRGKIEGNATRAVLDFTKMKPEDRLNKIKMGSFELDYRNSPAMQENQIQVSPDPMRQNALRIEPPRLKMGNMDVSVCNVVN